MKSYDWRGKRKIKRKIMETREKAGGERYKQGDRREEILRRHTGRKHREEK